MNDTLQNTPPSAIDNLFERSLIDLGIPPCPLVLERFMAEARKDEPDFLRLTSIISSDVSLAAGLIKTANSPFFGMRMRVRSVNEAIAVLGLTTASRAVAGIILRKTFPHLHSMERFWDASARIARLSGWLAQELMVRGLRPEDAYTFGLFRDCGIPVLLGRFPNYEELLERANHEPERCFTEVEESELPTNHAMVGSILAQSWWLPEEICRAIRNHHSLEMLTQANSDLPMMSRHLIAAAQLAEHILQRQLGLSQTKEWLKLGQACLNLLEMDEERLEEIYELAAPVAATEE